MSTNTKHFLDEAGLKALWEKIKKQIADGDSSVESRIETVETKIVELDTKIENTVPSELVFNNIEYNAVDKKFEPDYDGQGPVRSSIIADALNRLSTEFNNNLKNNYYTKEESDEKFVEVDDELTETDINNLF